FRRPTVDRFLRAQKRRIYRACSAPNFSAEIFVGGERGRPLGSQGGYLDILLRI
ncbi:hypothetical protein HMPREF1556_01320, partial [Porphyromonas sp. oral taxon 278 str. W7784]